MPVCGATATTAALPPTVSHPAPGVYNPPIAPPPTHHQDYNSSYNRGRGRGGYSNPPSLHPSDSRYAGREAFRKDESGHLEDPLAAFNHLMAKRDNLTKRPENTSYR